jgi:hypothetical protein
MVADVGPLAGGEQGASGSGHTEQADVSVSDAPGVTVVDGGTGTMEASQTEQADATGSDALGGTHLHEDVFGHTEQADATGSDAPGMIVVDGGTVEASQTEQADASGSDALGGTHWHEDVFGGAVKAGQTEQADVTGSGAPGCAHLHEDDSEPGHTEGADDTGSDTPGPGISDQGYPWSLRDDVSVLVVMTWGDMRWPRFGVFHLRPLLCVRRAQWPQPSQLHQTRWSTWLKSLLIMMRWPQGCWCRWAAIIMKGSWLMWPPQLISCGPSWTMRYRLS